MRGRFIKAIEGTLKAAHGPRDVQIEATSYAHATLHQQAGLRKRVCLGTLASYEEQGNDCGVRRWMSACREAIAMRLLDPPQVHQWTRDEYYKMAEVGLFEGKHVELIEGRIIEMSPMGSAHATGVSLVGDALRSVIGHGFFTRSQMPLDLGDLSEPEPDIAVVTGTARDYTNAHPKTAVLIVEVSESSLEYDRTEKASLYAEAGIPDYWVLNLLDRHLEVRRDPVPDPNQLYGFGYKSVTILYEGDFVSPLAVPQALIAVADLLP